MSPVTDIDTSRIHSFEELYRAALKKDVQLILANPGNKEVTALWERVQQRQGVTKWRPELEEEYKEREGNIYNRKTYTDLQHQGLI